MTHSPEPWEVEPWVGPCDTKPSVFIVQPDDDRDLIATLNLRNAHDRKALANANRIVACVNACKGIPTDVLQLAESACLINDQETGVSVYVNCGPPLESRASDSIP